MGSQLIFWSQRLEKLCATITPDCVAAVQIDNDERLRTDHVQNFHCVKVVVISSLCMLHVVDLTLLLHGMVDPGSHHEG